MIVWAKIQTDRLIYALSRSWLSTLLVILVIAAKSHSEELGALLHWPDMHQKSLPVILDFFFWGACTLFGVQIARKWNTYPNKTFRIVFGDGFADKEHFISLPSFKFNQECKQILRNNGYKFARQIFDPRNVGNIFQGGDIQKILASSDIVGARYLISRTGKHTKKGPQLSFGEDLTTSTENFMAFGLQTNPNTPYFFKHLSPETDTTVLYKSPLTSDAFNARIPEEVIELDNFTKCALEPTADHLTANIRITKIDGSHIEISAPSGQDWNIGLIMIVRKTDTQDGEYRRVLCGGVGPGGTTGSAYYLAHKWEKFETDLKNSKGYDAVASFTYTPCQLVSSSASPDNIYARDAETVELIRFGLKWKT